MATKDFDSLLPKLPIKNEAKRLQPRILPKQSISKFNHEFNKDFKDLERVDPNLNERFFNAGVPFESTDQEMQKMLHKNYNYHEDFAKEVKKSHKRTSTLPFQIPKKQSKMNDFHIFRH